MTKSPTQPHEIPIQQDPLVLSHTEMTRRKLIKRYGFAVTNLHAPFRLQYYQALQQITLANFLQMSNQNKTGYHNLCTTLTPPKGVEKLLRYGLKFCVEPPTPKPNLDRTMERITRDIRIKHFIATTTLDEDGYDPKIYLPDPSFDPERAPPPIEEGLVNLRTRLEALIKDNKQPRQHNLPPDVRKTLKELIDDKRFIVLPTDKNLGPCILERTTYIERCLKDHLLDETSYKQLSKAVALRKIDQAVGEMRNLVMSNWEELPKNEFTFLKRALKLEKPRIPQFYAPSKVHKDPWKTRPVVSCVNCSLGYLSKWVDRWLQKLLDLCPGYLQDSQALIDKLRNHGPIPKTAVLVVADAVSMYTNINTTHALDTMKKWLDLFKDQLPLGFPTKMVLDALELIMRNNIFQFDDTYWHQIDGTAMGTSTACSYATIYYAFHEHTYLLFRHLKDFKPPPTIQAHAESENTQRFNSQALLMYGRLIDDTIQLWDMAALPVHMRQNFTEVLSKEMEFGTLEWEVEEPTRTTNFLDLTVKLEPNGGFKTKTYVKPMNLHLYIPPESAHPKGVLKSLIFGNLIRYHNQNSKESDFINITKEFYQHLKRRGHKDESLIPLFMEAAHCINERAQRKREGLPMSNNTSAVSDYRTFIHWEYHPRGIDRRDIRQAYNETLAPLLAQKPFWIRQMTVAHSNPKNLRRCLTKTQLEEPPGQQASTYVERVKQQLSANL